MIRFDEPPQPAFQRYLPPEDKFLEYRPDEELTPESGVCKIETLWLHEVWFEPLKKRYRKACFVYGEHGAVRVKDDPRTPTREGKLLRNLRNMIEHPATDPHERANARKRVKEIGVRLEDEPEFAFLMIDREKLFLDNMEVQAEGLCGIFPKDRKKLWVYALDKEDVERWLEMAQYAADNYIKIPRRLTA